MEDELFPKVGPDRVKLLKWFLSELHNFAELKDAAVRGAPPPPIIFERLKLPQQIIYRRKENLS